MAQTPIVYDEYLGDGVTKVFALTWDYLSKVEVFVSVDGVNTSFTWLAGSSSSIELATAPAPTAVVRLYRNTRAFVPLHKFAGGVPFLPRYVDENSEQLLFALQEGLSDFGEVRETADLALAGVTAAQEAASAASAAASAAEAASFRAIRVPANEPVVPPLPNVAGRAGKLLSFDVAGNPIAVAPPSGSALDLELRLAAPTGATLVGYNAAPLATFLDKLRDPVATDGGVSLLGKGVRWFATIAELRTAIAGVAGVVYVAEEGRSGFFKVDPAVTVDNNITQYVSGTGVGFRRMYDGPINVRWAGAKCDEVTDDTATIQQVIDYCATFTDWPAIQIPGPALILGSLVVNREVIAHTDRAEWRVYGTGGTGGVHRVDANSPMFTSTLPMVNDPLSAWITWIDMRFTSPNRALGVAVLSKNFLQQKFINCYFLRVKCGTTDKYWQSMFFDHCNLRYTSGVFLNSSDTGYDIHYVGCISEYGESYLNNFSNGLYSFSFKGGLHEGALGGLLSGGGFSGVLISGNYFEYNQMAVLDGRAGNTNRSVVLEGNFFATASNHLADVNYYEVLWGNTTGAVSISNYCHNGRLHDNSAMSYDGMESKGDYAALALFKSPLLVRNAKGTWTPTAPGPMTVVQALYRREGSLVHVDFIVQFPAGGSANGCTISGLPYPAAASIISGRVAYADLATEVTLMGGVGAPNGTSTAFSICKTKQGARYTLTELNGVQIAGSLTYSI